MLYHHPHRTCLHDKKGWAIPMKGIAIVVLGLLLAGCARGPVDISSAYWAGRHDPKAQGAQGWPLWQKAPQRGVRIGHHSIPEMDRLEYVAFLWDDTGLYGRVFGFEFPQIDLAPAASDHSVVIMATTPARRRQTLGTVGALKQRKGEGVRLRPEEFRYIARGNVIKPGQCQTEFWVSWKALSPDASPTRITIRVKHRVLILDPQKKS